VVTLKMAEPDFARGSDPMGSPVSTNTLAVNGAANSSAGITAVSFVLLTKVVVSRVSLPLADHTTSLLLCGAPTKVNAPMAVTLKVRSGLPTVTLVGEMEMFADGGLEESGRLSVPPPQADCQRKALATATTENRLRPMLLQNLAASGNESECMIVLLFQVEPVRVMRIGQGGNDVLCAGHLPRFHFNWLEVVIYQLTCDFLAEHCSLNNRVVKVHSAVNARLLYLPQ
jgi:hypothetical protein